MTTTAGTTSRGYRYPGDASATDVPGDLKKLADDVNADVTAVAANGAVTTAKIADSAVTSAKIADGTIVAGDLADSAVTSAKIADGTIATGDLADSAVTSAKIADGTIVSSDLATSAVATSNIADSAVTSAKIADGTIVNADINAAAAIDVSKLTGVVASATVGNLLTSNEANAVAANWQGATADCTVSDGTGTVAPLVGSATTTITRVGSPVYTFMYTAIGVAPSTTYGAPVVPGRRYTASFYVRGDAANASQGYAQVDLVQRTAAGAVAAENYSSAVAVQEGSWTRVSITVVAASTAATFQLQTYLSSLVAGHVIHICGASVNEGVGGAWCEPGRVVTGLQPQLSVSSVSSAVTASAAQPVLSVSGTTTVTIPLAANNSGVKFTVINSGTGTVTVSRSGSDTISGLTSFTIPGKGQVEIISDGSAWLVLGGSYTTDAAGLATYAWDAVSTGWRLVAYDSGWRDVSSLLVNSWAASGTDGRVEARRTRDTIQAVLNLSAAAKTANTVLTLPAGFRPPRNLYAIGGQEGLSGTHLGASLSTAGVFVVGTATTSTQTYFTLNVPASSSLLPSSLPGTTVTSPF